MTWRMFLRRTSVPVAVVVLGALLVTAPVQADPVGHARGYAYGIKDGILSFPTPEVAATVPPGSTQHRSDEALNLLGFARTAGADADACLEGGVEAILQSKIDGVRTDAGRGSGPGQGAQVVEGPGGGETCLAPAPEGATTDVSCADFTPPEPTPTPSEEPSPTPSESPTTDPTATPEPTPNTPGICISGELWNARGHAVAQDFMSGAFTELESEAVARCVENNVEFATAVDYAISGELQDDPNRPNQQLDPLGLGLVASSTALFWETNWDPGTGGTTDGSDTVWVNALRINTPTEEIIIGRSEATVTCSGAPEPTPTETETGEPSPSPTDTGPDLGPTPPPGGFPRDISLAASKPMLHYNKTLSLTGSVTPATHFATPRDCWVGVRVTIRRDVVGPPQEFEDVGSVVTDSQGNFSFNYQADRNAQWLAFIDKDNPADCAQAASESQPVLVKPQVQLKPNKKRPRRGNHFRFRALVKPCDGHEGTRVKLRRQYQTRWVKLAWRRLDAKCRASFRLKANFKRAVFDVAWPKQDADHQTSASRAKVIITRKRR